MENTVLEKENKAISLLKIFQYWAPEAASIACIIFLPIIVDLLFVVKLNSTQTYSAIGMSSNLTHTLIKLSEAVSISGIATMGRYNGAEKFQDCGKTFFDSLTASGILGILQFLAVGMGANMFMRWIEAPDAVRFIAVPFIKVQAMAIFFAFTFMSFIGFFKAIKDTKTPFFINVSGIFLFLFLDYSLIFGKFGFPAIGYLGSAVASTMRYFFMTLLCIILLFSRKIYAKYFSSIDQIAIHPKNVIALIKMSLPIMVDKTVLTFSYIWLAKMIAPLGVFAIASIDSVKNIERLALIPAMAFSQIITFIVSNNLGNGDFKSAQKNIIKILALTLFFSASCLALACWKSAWLMSFLDPNKNFSDFACKILKIICPMMAFDLVQMTLAGALRGAGDVKTVMLTRFFSCIFIFIPSSLFVRKYLFFNDMTKIILIYACFYVSTVSMALVFIFRVLGTAWRQIPVPNYRIETGTVREKLAPSTNDARVE